MLFAVGLIIVGAFCFALPFAWRFLLTAVFTKIVISIVAKRILTAERYLKLFNQTGIVEFQVVHIPQGGDDKGPSINFYTHVHKLLVVFKCGFEDSLDSSCLDVDHSQLSPE